MGWMLDQLETEMPDNDAVAPTLTREFESKMLNRYVRLLTPN